MKSSLTCLIGLFVSINSLAFDFEQETKNLHRDLNAGDSAAFFSYFIPNALLYNMGEQGPEVLPLLNFVPVLKKFKTKEYSETFDAIIVKNHETGFISVDVSFTFYINERVAFSGIDHVVWGQVGDGFKIVNLYTGALKPKFTTANGVTSELAVLDNLMNQWHRNVALSNYDAYFNFMTSDFIFLGTDPSERWSKKQFGEFCKPYFEKKETWDFKPNWRNWYMNDAGDIAWFEESLATWMEECRGSGVLVKENGEWKIAHYNLTVLIENDKIKSFIKLRKK